MSVLPPRICKPGSNRSQGSSVQLNGCLEIAFWMFELLGVADLVKLSLDGISTMTTSCRRIANMHSHVCANAKKPVPQTAFSGVPICHMQIIKQTEQSEQPMNTHANIAGPPSREPKLIGPVDHLRGQRGWMRRADAQHLFPLGAIGPRTPQPGHGRWV